jgi:hypothetical protein
MRNVFDVPEFVVAADCVGRDPEKIGEASEVGEPDRLEWVPLASVLELISAGKIWNSGSLVALLRLLVLNG